MANSSWVNNAREAIARTVVDAFVQATIIPWGLAFMTAASALIQNAPIWFAIPVAGFAYAAFMTGLVRHGEYSEKNKVSDRLSLRNITVFVDKDLKLPAFAIDVNNSAPFPINMVIKRFDCALDDVISPKNKNLENTELLVPATQGKSIASHGFDCMDKVKGRMVRGHFKTEILYGRGNKLRYELIIEKQCKVWFDEGGNITTVSFFEEEF